MPTVDLSMSKKDVISPVLKENIPATNGHYYVTNTWILDATTHVPVGIKQEISLTE